MNGINKPLVLDAVVLDVVADALDPSAELLLFFRRGVLGFDPEDDRLDDERLRDDTDDIRGGKGGLEGRGGLGGAIGAAQNASSHEAGRAAAPGVWVAGTTADLAAGLAGCWEGCGLIFRGLRVCFEIEKGLDFVGLGGLRRAG